MGRRSTPNGSSAFAGADVVVPTMFCVAVIIGRASATNNNRQDTVRTTAVRGEVAIMSMVILFFLSQSFFVLFPRKLEKQLFVSTIGRV